MTIVNRKSLIFKLPTALMLAILVVGSFLPFTAHAQASPLQVVLLPSNAPGIGDTTTIRVIWNEKVLGTTQNVSLFVVSGGQRTPLTQITIPSNVRGAQTDVTINAASGFPATGSYTIEAQILDAGGNVIASGSDTMVVAAAGHGSLVSSRPDRGVVGAMISLVNLILGAVLGILRWVLWALGTYIIVPLLESMLTIDASQLASGPIVEGWKFVRDIVNMFFILILIVIGFATMLKIESYNYRRLLVKLVIMALLVNFSLTIGRIIIQITDAAQFSFLSTTPPPGGGESGITGVRALYLNLSTANVKSILDGFSTVSLSSTEALSGSFQIIFQFLLELGVVIVFAVLAIFMLIRTIGLWILLVLSPFAYALYVLPATSSIAKKWWDHFIKYALFAPILAFFLRLVLVMYRFGFELLPKSFGNLAGSTADYLSTLAEPGSVPPTFGQTLQLAMVYIVILAFLVGAVLVTKNMGIFGASAIMGVAAKGARLYSLQGSRYVGRRLGTPISAVGKAVSWVPGLRTVGAGMQKVGGGINKGMTTAFAIPGAIVTAYKAGAKKEEKEIEKASRAMLRAAGIISTAKEDREKLSAEDLKKLLSEPNKLSLQDIANVMQDAPLDALRGGLEELANPRSALSTDAAKSDIAMRSLYARFGGRGPMPAGVTVGTVANPAAPGGVNYTFNIPGAAPIVYSTASTDKAFERDILTDEQKAGSKSNAEAGRKRIDLDKQATGNPDLQKRILQMEVQGEIPSLSQARQAIEVERAMEEKTGERIPAEKSRIGPSGQRVLISDAVADKSDIQYDANLRYDENDSASVAGLESLLSSLKEEGASDADLAKVKNAAQQMGSISIQKGYLAPLKNLVEENEPQAIGRAPVTQGRSIESKQHERSHGFYNFVNKNSSADYQKLTDAVKKDKRFAELQQKFKANATYKDYSDEKIAEEILARTTTRAQLSGETQNAVEGVLGKYHEQFSATTKKIAQDSRMIEKSEALQKQILARNQGNI